MLRDLTKAFDTPDICIREENDGFTLRSERFRELTSHEEVRDHVAKILPALNGATKLVLGFNTPVTIGSIAKIRDDGTRHTYVFARLAVAPVTVMVDVKIERADGTTEEFHQAEPVVAWLKLSKRDAHVAWALRLIWDDFKTYPGLYKIYEAIEADVGSIPGKGWCTNTELKRFKRTANSPGALGVRARHGAMGSPPPDPMSLSSAKSLIRRLLNEWFKMKRAQYGL